MTDFVTSYLAWLKSQFSCRETGAYTEITTPFLDRHNDQIQIYAIQTTDGWSLTDAGETLSDLEMSGVRFESPKRRALLQEVLQGFGVTLKDGELTVAADLQSRPQQMNNLIQAMLSVNDLFCLAQPTVHPRKNRPQERSTSVSGLICTPRPSSPPAMPTSHSMNG